METANKGKEILLVDDDPNYSEVIRIRLETFGYQVSCAANGREAIDLLEKETHPNLIIMDVDMPDQNGLTTLINLGIRKSRTESNGRFDIPVIIATGLQSDRVREMLIDQKVSGYFQKPYDSEELVRKVKQLIG